METNKWQFKPQEIRNYKDLARAKEKLELHQEFLGELLHRDKLMLKEALRPSKLLEELIANSSSEKSYISGSIAMIKSIFKWILNKFI